ncbi:MAG: hypothetical protein RMY34_36585, partial [Aulosira sp. DedQUE10]|nr:hypothetical protein [Aulosira sp. DedQUE10]
NPPDPCGLWFLANESHFTPPLNPLPLARGGEVLRQQSRGGVTRIVMVNERCLRRATPTHLGKGFTLS